MANRFQRTIRDAAGNVAAAVAVTVTDPVSGSPVSIFTDEALTVAKANPGVTDANGRFDFWAADTVNLVDVTAGEGVSAYTLQDVLIGVPQPQPYANRATAEAANIPATVTRILVATPSGTMLAYIRAASAVGAALVTNDGGVGWLPDDDVTPDHWAQNTTPGTTDMTAAVAAAVAYSVANTRSLDLISNYLTTGSIDNLHAVDIRGPGAIVRGANALGLSPFLTSVSVYVATTGDDDNDGLSSAQPFLTIQRALDVCARYASYSRARWTVHLAAGTYTDGGVLNGVFDAEEIVVQGPSKATTILDGASSPTTVMGLNFNAVNRARVKNLTVRNWPGVGSGVIFQNGTRGVIEGCDGIDNAEANFNASEDAEMVLVGECASVGSRQGLRYYRNSGGSVGDGVNPITISGATQTGLVARDGSKVVCNDGLTVTGCNATATTAAVLAQKHGYIELRTCSITGNSIGVAGDHNSIIDTQNGIRTVTGNTRNYAFWQGSFDRAWHSSASLVSEWIRVDNDPSGLSPSSDYHFVLDHDGVTGIQILTNGSNANIDFDKSARVSYVASDSTLRLAVGAQEYRARSTGWYPGNNGVVDLGLSFARWRDLHLSRTPKFTGLSVYADNAAAVAGGLVVGDVYRTATGELRIVV